MSQGPSGRYKALTIGALIASSIAMLVVRRAGWYLALTLSEQGPEASLDEATRCASELIELLSWQGSSRCAMTQAQTNAQEA